MKDSVRVSGIWVRRIFDEPEVLIEVDGKWYHVELCSGRFGDTKDNFPFSEIIEVRPEMIGGRIFPPSLTDNLKRPS